MPQLEALAAGAGVPPVHDVLSDGDAWNGAKHNMLAGVSLVSDAANYGQVASNVFPTIDQFELILLVQKGRSNTKWISN